MEGFRKPCLLVSILFLLSLGGAVAQYEFGSKVVPGDIDENRLLDDFAGGQVPLTLVYWDIGAEAGLYDEMDPVYLHIGTAPNIVSNDIRLTPYGIYPAGSKVTAAENDIGQPFTPLPANVPSLTAGAIYYNDLYGITTGYDSEDSVYVKATFFGTPSFPGPATIVTNDVRITPIITATGTLPGGAKVKKLDPDSNNWAQPMLGLFPPVAPPSIASIRFFNANGNVAAGVPVYDYPDVVYIDVPLTAGLQGAVSPNDVRLTI